ncbi:TRAP transporter small permease [uncultured Pseudacidovorax sp.]|uniref:TRAP transporter small permease n=1 Tax=uncultured Pseudacidovorax sp. TaxID=679313 RepID=UPI0025EB0A02|nr:TRAP transporter small permease [uncultured Pseudacidovorax sp.]
MIDATITRFCRAIDLLIAAALAIMVVLVFGNVVLRYALNSGIAVSEELSRWLFVWLCFLGAVVALRDGAHLGTDMLVSRLSATGKKVCLVIGQLLMLYLTWLFLDGSWQQMRLNLDMEAPVTGTPVAVFYASGVVFSVLAGLLLVLQLVRVLTGRISESELVMVRESEEQAELEALQAELARDDAATGPAQPHAASGQPQGKHS